MRFSARVAQNENHGGLAHHITRPRYFRDSDYFGYEASADEPVVLGRGEKLIGVNKRAETDHIIFTTAAMTVRNGGGRPVRIHWNSLGGMEPPEKRFAKASHFVSLEAV